MLNGLLGILFGLIWQKITKQNIFPFAPAICASMFLCLIFDKKIDPVVLLGNLIF
jgi:prepilin signal peptidase PulO-like enzyme (type II secretory pathway)